MSANSKSGPLTSSVGAKKTDAITNGTDEATKDSAAQPPASNGSSQAHKKKDAASAKPASFQSTSQIS